MKNIVRSSIALICCSALLFLASCDKENLDDTNTTVNGSNGNEFDCEDLSLNYGDVCKGEGFSGVLNQNCECVESNSLEPDCPEFYFEGFSDGNYGSPCEAPGANLVGIIGDDCDCIDDPNFDCPDLGNIGDVCYIYQGGSVYQGTVSVDCDCLESNTIEFDCENLQANIGDSCQNGWGTLNADCDCVENENFCSELIGGNANYPSGYVGDECWTANDQQGFISENCECLENSLQDYTIEGRWLWSPGPTIEGANTMYEFSNGVRYTYYCGNAECDEAYWNSLEISDAIPGTENYTFEDGVLTVGLNFGNELVTPLTFECDGNQVNFVTPGYSLYRIGSDCD